MFRSLIYLIYCGGWTVAAVGGDIVDNCNYTDLTPQNLDITRNKVRIDFSSVVTPCKSKVVRPGLLCGHRCRPNYYWCLDDYSISCDVPEGQFTTNNRALCSNSTVWINQTCEQFYSSGRKASLGRRCTGEVQQCITPWYLSANYYYEVSEQLNI